MTLLQLPFNELLEVTTHLIFISDYIVFFVEVVRIMKSSCGKNDKLRGHAGGFDKGLRTLLTLKEIGLKDIGFG